MCHCKSLYVVCRKGISVFDPSYEKALKRGEAAPFFKEQLLLNFKAPSITACVVDEKINLLLA